MPKFSSAKLVCAPAGRGPAKDPIATSSTSASVRTGNLCCITGTEFCARNRLPPAVGYEAKEITYEVGMALIEFVDVGVCYRRRGGGETVALDRTSLAIAPGEFVCIVGPSGCGKTTLLHCLDGLHAPTSGRILIDGREITAPGRDRAMVFQSASLMPWRTVVRNVTYGLELHGVPLHQAIPRAQAMIEL